MAIDTDVQNDKFPYLARQICGDIAKAFGYGIDHIYEEDLSFIKFLKAFSIDTLSGTWLDMLGIVMGIPRPYVSKPELEEAFQFDGLFQSLEGEYHGFSTTDTVTIDGVEYDRTDGGLLDNIYRDTVVEQIGDSIYKKYILATGLLKKTRSIANIANVLETFFSSKRYSIEFYSGTGYINDILIVLPTSLADYQQSLQSAFDRIFTTPPFVLIDVSLYFDDLYTIPILESKIEEIIGASSGYTISYSYVNTNIVFEITLESTYSSYSDTIQETLEAYFEDSPDVEISVTVEE